ncbi:unnamed protein product [Didymodactylos carnosus]|uniref:WD repeat-containing protein 60 n=1 Tax=Didymodactylos carnosus TaxID=1234261 RepID=A0A8S2ECB6_9BILA|nr:unnamed protein product [Didymodactylos carnosus]CAF3876255.1 unnamed protein product [Didymodactylos carnosus]
MHKGSAKLDENVQSRDTSKSKRTTKDEYRDVEKSEKGSSSRDKKGREEESHHRESGHRSKSKSKAEDEDYSKKRSKHKYDDENEIKSKHDKDRKERRNNDNDEDSDERRRRKSKTYEGAQTKSSVKIDNEIVQKHKKQKITETYAQVDTGNYSDDFEQGYDDDFDEDVNDDIPVKGSTNFSKADIKVYSCDRRFYSHDTADKIRSRYRDLSRLIELDRQSFNILDITPTKSYAVYMRDFINPNSTQAKTQTNDDNENIDTQTDEIEQAAKWTQHPAESIQSCGGGDGSDNKTDQSIEDDEILRLLHSETDLKKYQNFVDNAGKLMLAFMGENTSKSTSSKSNETMQKESDLDFSRGVTILKPIDESGDMNVSCVCFCEDKPDHVAIFYESIKTSTTHYGAIYNVRDPEKPVRILSCEAPLQCCCSSIAYIFAGCKDGSVLLWDTTEPNRYKISSNGSQRSLPNLPTFSTANISLTDYHYNEVIRLLPLRAASATSKADRLTASFSLASLDADGRIILWSVVELSHTDEAGSIADLGLKPGGKVRMTQTSSIKIRTSIYMPRDSIQVYDVACPANDVDNLYGGIAPPSKLRLTSLEYLVEVTCLAFNPMVSKLLIVGTAHGELNLYTTGRGIDQQTIVGCSWSMTRPSVFFAYDSGGTIKYWDLSINEVEPMGSVTVPNLTHFILSSSNAYETSFAIVVRTTTTSSKKRTNTSESTSIEVHQLKKELATHSDKFQDKFKRVLRDILTDA